jgi:hypothetical protein
MNPQKWVTSQTRQERRQREQGLCVDCSQPAGGRARCLFHLQKHAKWALRYYHEGKSCNRKQMRGQETPELPFG